MRYICVHGHFYQPPRENPSLEAIELEDSAYPYHDWNERITAECYGPNAASRILDGERRIVEMVNNYSKMSFNFGPTLLSWLEAKASAVYQAILEADRASLQTFSGHGSALAQAYNHMILPLANRRDKVTQVRWGIHDFEHRFGRRPEGLWLPETAVDTETLEVLAELGTKFTILAPRQAHRVRRRSGRHWKDVSGDRIDPSRAYLVRLPSRRSISVFFYDGPISRAVAFEGLLDNGERFAERLLSGFSDARDWPQLVHIATDGESYGHHHRYGEMALTYALRHIESNQLAELTNYGRYLERYPPDHFVEIFDNSSWSCMHGVERWRANCGCNSGGHPEWNQEWRAPLREALDWLRDTLAPLYEQKAGALLKDPWAARDAYIRVILDRSPENVENFLAEHAGRPLAENEKIAALKLLEIERHALLMYTSCGWFFDELSGIETVQVIHYAGRAIQLAAEVGGDDLEPEFLERLKRAKSNIPEHGDGARIFQKFVRPARVDMPKLAAHYAISSMFESYNDEARIYCYTASRQDYSLNVEGKLRLAVGRARFTSEITRDTSTLAFGMFHLGDHNISGGVRTYREEDAYHGLKTSLTEAFSKADTTAVIRLLDESFSKETYSLSSLFRDEQRKIVNLILEDTLAEAASVYRHIFENHAPLIRFLTGLGIPVPGALRAAAELALNSQLREAFKRPEVDVEGVRALLKEAASMSVTLDVATLEFVVRRKVEEAADRIASHSEDIRLLQRLSGLLDFVKALPFPVTLWQAQNTCYFALAKTYEERRLKAEAGDAEAQAWVNEVKALREKLGFEDTH